MRNGGRNPAISRGDFSRDLGKLPTSRESSAVIGQDKYQALERHFGVYLSRKFLPFSEILRAQNSYQKEPKLDLMFFTSSTSYVNTLFFRCVADNELERGRGLTSRAEHPGRWAHVTDCVLFCLR